MQGLQYRSRSGHRILFSTAQDSTIATTSIVLAIYLYIQ